MNVKPNGNGMLFTSVTLLLWHHWNRKTLFCLGSDKSPCAGSGGALEAVNAVLSFPKNGSAAPGRGASLLPVPEDLLQQWSRSLWASSRCPSSGALVCNRGEEGIAGLVVVAGLGLSAPL